MTRLIENVYISNAKLEEDRGNKINTQWGSSWSQVGFQIGTLFLGLIKASSPGPSDCSKTSPSKLPRFHLSQKRRNRLICILHLTAPETLQCEDLKLTFSLEDVSWMQEERESQLSQGTFKDLSGNKTQTVLFRQYISNVLSCDLPYFK